MSLKRFARQLPTYLLVILICGIWIIPFLWMVLTSFKPAVEIYAYPPKFLADRWTLGSYLSLLAYPGLDQNERLELGEQGVDIRDIYDTDHVFTRGSSMGLAYLNVTKIAILNILGVWVVSSMAGYAFAHIQFPGREKLFVLLLTSMMIPWMVVLLPRFILFRNLGWMDSHLPLIMPRLLFGTAFTTFFFRQHFKSIPRELIEAARIDGASHLQIHWLVMMPLAKSVMATLAILMLVVVYNDLLNPLLYLQDPKLYTPTLILFRIMSLPGAEHDPSSTGLRMATAVLIAAPIITLFFFFQRYFIQGLTQGAVKE